MRPPRKFTPDQRHEIWERIAAGESPASVADRWAATRAQCARSVGEPTDQ